MFEDRRQSIHASLARIPRDLPSHGESVWCHEQILDSETIPGVAYDMLGEARVLDFNYIIVFSLFNQHQPAEKEHH